MKKRRFFAGLLAVLLSLLMGCAQQPQQVQYTLPESGVIVTVAYYIGFPYFESIEQLTDHLTDIYEGKVTRIYFDILNSNTGEALSKHPEILETADKIYDLDLYTVYEVEPTRYYKGEKQKKVYIAALGGIDDPDMLAEQYHVMVDAGMYRDNLGITVRDYELDIRVGETYLFLTDNPEKTKTDYSGYRSPYQCIYPLDDTSPPHSGGFTYSQIREYLLNNPQK